MDDSVPAMPKVPGLPDVLGAVAQPATAPRGASKGTATCPSCARKPLLERFPRYETVTYEPLMYCPFCYGFWARGDSLSRGVADPYSDHPALRQVPVSRCKACAGPLDPEQKCRKCGKVAPLLECPSCGKTMMRARTRGITLDMCTDCKGVWFETGEICAMFDLASEPSSFLERIAPPTPEGQGFGINEVADLIGLALAFLP